MLPNATSCSSQFVDLSTQYEEDDRCRHHWRFSTKILVPHKGLQSLHLELCHDTLPIIGTISMEWTRFLFPTIADRKMKAYNNAFDASLDSVITWFDIAEVYGSRNFLQDFKSEFNIYEDVMLQKIKDSCSLLLHIHLLLVELFFVRGFLLLKPADWDDDKDDVLKTGLHQGDSVSALIVTHTDYVGLDPI
ncbi:unnamed protein product [Lactuca saligna]|uniref:Uncharacterized protein n=1 Tax=Lactuca saligna TaxID=75948 RepID=A0AA36DY89_LACSI|nr:unnamed protein product [Lactuca saligna]